jgi:multiple sugar transport system permease protein
MIMILAGLQRVSQDLLEAAQIDGATAVQRFRHVTVPQIRSVLVVIILLSFIWTFNDFGLIQIMTQGGPLNATMVLPVLIRTLAFKHLRMGTASALALMLAVVLLALSVVYLRFAERGID